MTFSEEELSLFSFLLIEVEDEWSSFSHDEDDLLDFFLPLPTEEVNPDASSVSPGLPDWCLPLFLITTIFSFSPVL